MSGHFGGMTHDHDQFLMKLSQCMSLDLRNTINNLMARTDLKDSHDEWNLKYTWILLSSLI